MLRRWLLILAIVCGLLSAPLTMASERVAPDSGAAAASHCADRTGDPGSNDEHPAPAKQFRCMGACFGVETGIAHLPERAGQTHAALALPVMPGLAAILIEHELPPPRRA